MPSPLANGQLAYLKLVIDQTQFLDGVIEQVALAESIMNRSGKRSMPGNLRQGDVVRYWRTKADKERMARYRKYREIWKAAPEAMKHLTFEWLEGIGKDCEYRDFKILPKVSFDLTTFLLGKGVDITTQLPKFDKFIKQELDLDTRLFKWMQEVSTYGYIGLQTVVKKDCIEVIRILPDYLFPKVKSDSDDELEYISKRTLVLPEEDETSWDYVKGMKDKNNLDGIPAAMVFEERHFKGYIEYYYWIVDQDDVILGEIPVNMYDANLKSQIVFTGIDDFAITLIYCWEVGTGEYRGDWDYLLDAVRSINARSTQVCRLLNKHGSPLLKVGDEHLVRDPRSGRVTMPNWKDFIVSHGDDTQKPEYLNPQIEISAHESDLKFLIGQAAVQSHLAPQLLDPFAQIIENASAYKMSLTPTLAMLAQRGKWQIASFARFLYNHLKMAHIWGALDTEDFKDNADEPGDSKLELKKSNDKGIIERAGTDQTKKQIVGQAMSAGVPEEEEEPPLGETTDNSQKSGKSEQEDEEDDEPGYELQNPIKAKKADGTEDTEVLTPDLYRVFKLRNKTFCMMLKPQRINVRFKPAIPQDDTELLDRAGLTSSVHRILQDVDGMTEAEADAEWQKILEEKDEGGSTFDNNFGKAPQPFTTLDEDGNPVDINGQPVTPPVAGEGSPEQPSGEASNPVPPQFQ